MFKIFRGVLATLLIAGTANVAMAQGAPKLHTVKNSVKYKNAGTKPATGRSGSASLEARVLIAKDGTMLLQASTAGVEAATHPGTITKMQVKIGPDFTQNHNGLNAGGFWSHTMPAAPRGMSVQLQANIKGIDPKRNDVVTIAALAARRPDLAVVSVQGPATSAPNTPVTFFSNVTEENGDVGARANCVFSVDGTTTDTIPGIWVDANGSVACQFSHTFTTPGTYTVGTAATGVNPADWDTANNSATTTITVVNPNVNIANGYMEAYQHDYEYRNEWSRSGGEYCQQAYYYLCVDEYKRLERQLYSSVYMHGNTAKFSPVGQRVEAIVTTNGAVRDAVTLTPTSVWSQDYGYYKQTCADYNTQGYYDGTKWFYPGYYASMCSYAEPGNNDYKMTHYNFQKIVGDVTYTAKRKYCYSDGSCYEYDEYAYYYNNYQYGNGQSLDFQNGEVVGLNLKFVDVEGGEHTLDKSVTVQLQHDSTYTNGPHTWYDYWYGTNTEFQSQRQRWLAGWIQWNDQQ